MASRLRILFLEPFYGGSHRDVADGLVAHSRHRIDLVTLPDRFWKWRLRGAALYWARKIQSPQVYDGLLVSGLMSLADLKALWGRQCPPTMVYFHENQFNYPLTPGETMDYQFGFTNISTALTAERVLFNSRYHLRAFLDALPQFIRMMPDCRPQWVTPAITEKAAVVNPGCHFDPQAVTFTARKDRPPLIIWNHRWEHDKNPEAFFQALTAVQEKGIDFQVALLGQAYGRRPPVFDQALAGLGDRIVQNGHVPTREAYYRWLARGAVVVSTALQENFGIAVAEAVAHGCLPLVPNRLAYPELIPRRFHPEFLYDDQKTLETRLAHMLTHQDDYEDQRAAIAASMAVYAWPNAVKAFDQELERLSSTFKVVISGRAE